MSLLPASVSVMWVLLASFLIKSDIKIIIEFWIIVVCQGNWIKAEATLVSIIIAITKLISRNGLILNSLKIFLNAPSHKDKIILSISLKAPVGLESTI